MRHIKSLRVFPMESLMYSFRALLYSTVKSGGHEGKKKKVFLLQSRPIVPLRKESVCICICTSTISTMLYAVTSEKWIRESGQFSTPIIHFFNIPRYWTANTGNFDTANHRRSAQHLFRL